MKRSAPLIIHHSSLHTQRLFRRSYRGEDFVVFGPEEREGLSLVVAHAPSGVYDDDGARGAAGEPGLRAVHLSHAAVGVREQAERERVVLGELPVRLDGVGRDAYDLRARLLVLL